MYTGVGQFGPTPDTLNNRRGIVRMEDLDMRKLEEYTPAEIADMQAKLDASRMAVSSNRKFAMFVSWLMAVPCVIMDLQYPTAATDGKKIMVHPGYLMASSLALMILTIMHELFHIVLFHTDGRGKAMIKQYGMETANIGMDHVVNLLIESLGYDIPDDWYCDSKYKDWSADEVCADLDQEKKKQGGGGNASGSGNANGQPSSGKGGGHEQIAEASPEQIKEAVEAVKAIEATAGLFEEVVKKAESDGSSDGQGSQASGNAMERARNLRHKHRDWRLELDDFKGHIKGEDKRSSFSKMRKRSVAGVVQPGRVIDGEPKILLLMDSSGSMCSKLPTVMAEAEDLSQSGYSFTAYCSDGHVYGPYEFAPGEFDYTAIPLKGGGGSNMRPLFEKAKEHAHEVDAIIFCTDGDISWPSKELMDQLPPSLLVLFNYRRKKEQEKLFYKNILIN